MAGSKLTNHREDWKKTLVVLPLLLRTLTAVASSALKYDSALESDSYPKYDFTLKYEFFWKMDGELVGV